MKCSSISKGSLTILGGRAVVITVSCWTSFRTHTGSLCGHAFLPQAVARHIAFTAHIVTDTLRGYATAKQSLRPASLNGSNGM
jgi:hypothetical protein